MKRAVFGGLLAASCFLVFTSAGGSSGGPMEAIRETTERILEVISTPELKGPDKAAARQEMIREAVDERFDWEEIARRSLGRHWRGRTEAERDEFKRLVRELAGKTLLVRLEEYTGEKVTYVEEEVDGKYGQVKIKILTDKSQNIPINYRMKYMEDGWRVYDILIEGVSLVNNYRVQFNEILTKGSYGDLVERLEQRLRELEEGRAKQNPET